MIDSAHCPNCGSERSGHYCARCGQKDQPLRQSTISFLREAINELVGVDGRLWVTLRLLLLKPGRLTSEHLQGRRKRYLAPLRLYLSATVVFFFLLSVLDPAATIETKIGGSMQDTTVTARARLTEVEVELDSVRVQVESLQRGVVEPGALLDSLRASLAADSALQGISTDGKVVDEVARKVVVTRLRGIQVKQRRLEFQKSILETYPPDSTIRPVDLIDAAELLYQGQVEGVKVSGFGDKGPPRGPLSRVTHARTRTEMASALSGLVRSIIERIPVVMFLMLPVFALLMKLVYVRGGWYYSEHLIFALHNHAVAFIGFTMIAVLVAVAGGPAWIKWPTAGVLFGLNVYFLAAQKHVYAQGWLKTLVKFALVFVSYWTVIMFFGFSILVVLASFSN